MAAIFVAMIAVTYGVVEHRATPRPFPSPTAALGVGRGLPPGVPRLSASTGTPINIKQAVSGIDSPDEGRGADSPSSLESAVALPAHSAPASLDAGARDTASVPGSLIPEADGASAAAAPLATSLDASAGPPSTPSGSNDEDHISDRPSLEDEAAMMSLPRPVTSSSFDDEDLVDRHPVSDDESPFVRNPPPLTSSSFDDEDLLDRHPVSDDQSPFNRNEPPLTFSSFDDEDLLDRHPVSDDRSPFVRNPPPLTSSSFDHEDLVDRHPVPR